MAALSFTWATLDAAQDGSESAIKAQIFDAAGAKVGSEFLVNDIATSFQGSPHVVSLASGGFAIAWATNDLTPTNGFYSKLKIYDAAGTDLTGDLTVNTPNASSQSVTSITELSNGDIVVVWGTGGLLINGDTTSKGQVFSSLGGKKGSEFVVGSGGSPEIAALDGGGFAATWTDPFNGIDARVRVFDDAGTPVSAEIQASSLPGSTNAQEPSIAALPNGGFVVTWRGADAAGTGITARLFDAAGTGLGGEFSVNTETEGSQFRPMVSTLPDGRFVIAWYTQDGTQDGDGFAIKAQVFDATGTPDGGEFLVNDQTVANQFDPVVSALTDGRFVIGWRTDDAAQDGDESAVKARIFTPDNTPPVATPDAPVGDEDTTISGAVSAADVDGDTVVFSKASDPANGSVVVNADGSYDYTPNADYNGPDSFDVLADDQNGGTDTVTVNVTVNPVNDAPVAADDTPSGDEDTIISGTVSATDADGDAVVFSKASDPNERLGRG